MATLPSRRRIHSVSSADFSTAISGDINSRYDMSLPQNWTIAQLKAILQYNVPFNSSAKKSKLIQQCRKNGIIDTRVLSTQPEPSFPNTESGSEPDINL